MIGRVTLAVAPANPRSLKKSGHATLFFCTAVHSGQYGSKHVTFELLSHVAFVADDISNDIFEPARILFDFFHNTHNPQRFSGHAVVAGGIQDTGRNTGRNTGGHTVRHTGRQGRPPSRNAYCNLKGAYYSNSTLL